jgi:hypothetical protein
VPGEPRAISLSDARNDQGKIGRRLASLEKISEEVPQMRGGRFVTQRWPSLCQLLQEGRDVSRRNRRQIWNVRSKAESQETIGKAPAIKSFSR